MENWLELVTENNAEVVIRTFAEDELEEFQSGIAEGVASSTPFFILQPKYPKARARPLHSVRAP